MFIVVLFSVVTFFVTFYVTDPLQIFHKSWFHEDRLNPHMREQAAGIINNFTFDSIILGTSMLENTSAKEASEKIGGNFFNISLSGSNFYERSFVLSQACKKNLKNVVYSLDSVYINQVKERVDYPTKLWSFLYNSSKLDDFKVYFQKKYLLYIFLTDAHTRKIDFDMPNVWFTELSHARRFGGLQNWVKNSDNPQVHNFLLKELPEMARQAENPRAISQPSNLKLEQCQQYIDEHIFNIIKEYQNTKFYFIFPPYFRYSYTKMIYDNTYYIHKFAIRYIVSKTKSMPNVHIYGFEDLDFLDNIENYKDTGHYHQKFNSFMLDAIAQNQHRLTPDNVDAYLAKAEQRALTFDVVKLNNEAQSLLREYGVIKP